MAAALRDGVRSVHVRKNDTVVVLAGKDKGRTARVLRVFPSESRAIVEGVNFHKKHTRPNPQRNIKGGILERETPIHTSNIMVVCNECKKPSRVGHKRLEDGKKVRTCRRCGGILDK
ncbi:MAG TPA: 50S ribosomal protein L24 [Candidatus Polarisedimenticolia bacterium]|jgi:large subunit ribosomal protein L24|nr:50S ribosomal protein L24 [Candidatus Polarisedimenticolia bacterium]